MEFEYPSQRFQDWLSQKWVMARGRRIDPARAGWLMGPYGDVDVIADGYIARLAEREGLTVERSSSTGGMLEGMELLLGGEAGRLDGRIRHFYEHTAEYDLEAWSQWRAAFRPFAGLIRALYSRRLQQLNLPLGPLETARGMKSEVIKLRDAAGVVRYTVWFRVLRATGQVIYSGVYMLTRLPDGRVCAKIVFPLPRGNATVVMLPRVVDGGLELVSSGGGFGEPGFYFLLRDKRGRHWSQYIRSFRERIHVYVDGEGVLRADHTLGVWGITALRLHYRMQRRAVVEGAAGAAVSAGAG